MNGLLEEHEERNLLIKIVLHRLCASITVIIVLLCIVFIDYVSGTIIALVAMLVLEIIWCTIHLRFKRHSGYESDIKSKKKLLFQVIEKHVELKYKKNRYPGFPLVVEAVFLTFLCVITGGIKSPFFSLFTIFSVLGLYVLDRRNPILAIIDVVSLCLCFFVIAFSENIIAHIPPLNMQYITTQKLQVSPSWVFVIIAMYALTMTCYAFYNIAVHYAEQEADYAKQVANYTSQKKEICELPFRQTEEFLWTQREQIGSYSLSGNGHVFIIGNNPSLLNPQGTLALLPYCSRGSHCQIRSSDEHCTSSQTTTDGCRYCDESCDIGEVFKLKGSQIAEIKVIGSSHKIDDVINEFCKNGRKLTHVIVVCCISNLTKYLPKGMTDYKNVTVIYTPVILGNEICVSSTSPGFHDRPPRPLPCTSFDSDALIRYLKQE